MPVSLEFVLMLVLNFVNQVVVGALGATAIAAVGFANSLVFILVLTLGALGASVSILVARAHGSGRRHEMNTTVTAAVLVAALLAAADLGAGVPGGGRPAAADRRVTDRRGRGQRLPAPDDPVAGADRASPPSSAA